MTSEETVIRCLGPDDVNEFRSLRLEALRETPESFGSTYASEAAYPPARFVERLAGGTVFGSFRDQRLVGMAGYSIEPWEKTRHKAGLWGMYVQPSRRGQGIATALAGAVIAAAAERVEILQLKVVSSNDAAIRLYRALGFVEYGLELKGMKQDGRYYDEVLMALDLAAGAHMR